MGEACSRISSSFRSSTSRRGNSVSLRETPPLSSLLLSPSLLTSPHRDERQQHAAVAHERTRISIEHYRTVVSPHTSVSLFFPLIVVVAVPHCIDDAVRHSAPPLVDTAHNALPLHNNTHKRLCVSLLKDTNCYTKRSNDQLCVVDAYIYS